jgi:hypothetical protein
MSRSAHSRLRPAWEHSRSDALQGPAPLAAIARMQAAEPVCAARRSIAVGVVLSGMGPRAEPLIQIVETANDVIMKLARAPPRPAPHPGSHRPGVPNVAAQCVMARPLSVRGAPRGPGWRPVRAPLHLLPAAAGPPGKRAARAAPRPPRAAPAEQGRASCAARPARAHRGRLQLRA